MSSRKRGVVAYKENPFVLPTTAMATAKKRVVVQGGKAIVDTATGEYENVAEVVMVKQVDSEQFVKLFTQNLRVFFDLTPVTMKLLEVLLSQVQRAPHTDKVMLNLAVMQNYFTEHMVDPMSKASFHRAVRELIEKSFIAETVLAGLYFINPNLFFNGDRFRFMTEIRRAKIADGADDRREQSYRQVDALVAEMKNLTEAPGGSLEPVSGD